MEQDKTKQNKQNQKIYAFILHGKLNITMGYIRR